MKLPWSKPQPEPDEDGRSKKRVLVVDDEQEIGAYFQLVLKRLGHLGFDLNVESDPQRALGRVRDEAWDLVISDFHMPLVDGVTLLAAAKEANPESLRILMTGYNAVPTTSSRLLDAHVDAYLQKPFRTQDLQIFLFDFIAHHDEAIAEWRERARRIERRAGLNPQVDLSEE